MSIFKKEVDLVNSVDFFMKNYTPFPLSISFSRRRFVILDNSVKNIDFIVKINYNKDEFGHLITQFVGEMIRSIKENKELNDASF